MTIEIVGKWRASEGETAQGMGGWSFQITALRFAGELCFVREAMRQDTPSFLMSAGTRWGQKHGRYRAPQVLYLSAPASVWSEVAGLVSASEGRSAEAAGKSARPVMRHRLWTPQRARDAIGRSTTTRL